MIYTTVSTAICGIPQSIASVDVAAPRLGTVTYGQRFRVLRHELWTSQGKTVLALAKKLDSKYPTTIYNIERQWRVPLLPTLTKHAAALGCAPWDLLIDVETEYDLVRRLADVRKDEADQRWRAIVRRYRETAERTNKRVSEAAAQKKRPRSTSSS